MLFLWFQISLVCLVLALFCSASFLLIISISKSTSCSPCILARISELIIAASWGRVELKEGGGAAEAESGVVVVFGKAWVDRFDKSEETEEVVVVEFED